MVLTKNLKNGVHGLVYFISIIFSFPSSVLAWSYTTWGANPVMALSADETSLYIAYEKPEDDSLKLVRVY